MTIHERFEQEVELAKTYAEDGAFASSAAVLHRLADRLMEHHQNTQPQAVRR